MAALSRVRGSPAAGFHEALRLVVSAKRSQNFLVSVRVFFVDRADEELPMAERNAPHSLNRESADQIRNQQRGGDANPPDAGRDGGPEGNATLRGLWDEPGGDAYAYRQAMTNERKPGRRSSELTAAETPETTRHLSDASLSPDDKDATAEAIDRATAVTGKDGNANMPKKNDNRVGSSDGPAVNGGRQTAQQAEITKQEGGGRSDAERASARAGKSAARQNPALGGSSGGHSDQLASRGAAERPQGRGRSVLLGADRRQGRQGAPKTAHDRLSRSTERKPADGSCRLRQ